MALRRLWRPLTAAAAVAAALIAAPAAGSAFAVAFLALMFGIVAGSVIWAPSAQAPAANLSDDEGEPAGLPDASAVIDAIDDPMLIVRDRRVLHANGPARKVLGEHIVGVDVRLAIRHPAAAERLIPRGEETGDRLSRIELIGLGESERHWIMTILRLDDGSRLVRLADRSEVHASEQMRTDFVANASHELRTPLATLIGFCETLEDDQTAEDRSRRHRFLRIMSDEARRMQQLIDDLISLSRIEAERFSPPRDPVALVPVIESVRTSLAQLIETKRGAIRVERGEFDPVVLGDRSQLQQLIQNLVVNALKYGRADTDVVVRFEEKGPDMLLMSVIDQGDGIAPEHLPRLTERFYRVDPSRSRAMGGTGLGLAIVKHIVGRHRGRINIRSTVGEGTCVRVFLPRANPAKTET